MSSFTVVFIAVLFIASSSINAETLHCPDAFECTGHDINTVTTDSNGYKSTFGPNTTITSTQNAACLGAFSCYRTSSIFAPEIECGGSNACSDVNNMTATRFICSGPNSCAYSNLTATQNDDSRTRVRCEGYKSCAHSIIRGIATVDAYAAYALYNSTIYSNTYTSATFSGYHSGLNTKLICGLNDTCVIRCYDSGCFMLYADCRGNCTINAHPNNSIFPLFYLQIRPNLTYETAHSTMNNDEACNKESAQSYDNEAQMSNIDIAISTNQTFCCRAYKFESRTTWKILDIFQKNCKMYINVFVHTKM